VQYKKFEEHKDLFPIFVEAGVLLMALEILMSQTIWRSLP